MNIQIIRHRATRKSMVGILNAGTFECFTLERNTDMLDEGAHNVKITDGVIMIGDHRVSDNSRKDGAAGVLGVGLSVGRYNLHETGNAYEGLKKVVAAAIASGDQVISEITNEIKEYENENY